MRTKTPAGEASARSGRTAVVLLAALLLALVALVFLWNGRGGEGGERGARIPGPSSETGAEPSSDAPLPSAEQRTAEDPVQDEHAPVVRPLVFDGRGAIRGLVVTPPGVALPERFLVVVEPARYMEGGARAERREVEVTGAAPEFAIEDLPQAGYRVYAKAAGMNSRISEVALVKGSSEVYKVLELRAAGHVDGAVRDEAGAPAADLQVTLDDLITGERMQTKTDLSGVWRLEGVRDSRYRLRFGHPERPLLPPEELDFKGSSLQYPDRTIPVTASVVLRIVDERSEPLIDARIRGWGNAAGPFDLHSEQNGIARAAYLLPGQYIIEVEHESGRKGKTTIQIEGEERDRIYQIVCRPPGLDARLR